MNFPRNLLSDAVRFGLAAGAVGLLGLTAAPAFAQDDDAATLDRIEVTGSRIRRVDTETSQPVYTISRADIEQQGFSSVADILQNLSAMGNPPLSRAQPLSSGENAGGTYISLRDLGANRTLVLLNGKRLGATTSGFQDISQIPSAIIERIEILKDGASSIYGSDAIGGVINLITRSGFDGMQGNAYYGQYDEGDGPIEKYDMLFGVSGDRGSLTLAIEYGTEGMVMAKDRGFSAFPQSDRHPTVGWTPASQWGHLIRPASLGGGVFVLNRGADFRSFGNFHPQNTAEPHGPDKDVTNTLTQTSLRSGQELRSFFVNSIYELTPTTFWRTEALYNERENNSSIAGYPYQSTPFATPMSAQSYYNPLGTWHGFATPTAVQFIRRTFDIPRTTEATTHTWRFSTTVEGSFEIGERYFTWDVAGMYSNSQILRKGYGDLNISRVRDAVGPSFLNSQGVVQCGTPAAPIALTACVPWNPFIPAGRVGDGGLTGNAALQNYLFQTLQATGDTETTILTANVAGDIVELPAGALSFALGAETRKEEGGFTPDALAVTGNSSTLAASPTLGDYSLDEVYAELLIPVLTDATFAKELSFNVATRYSDYDTFGDTTNSKAGFKWSPMDSLIVRGTWAQGFRAPTISDLFGGGSQTFSFFQDPCDTVFGAAANSPAVRANCARDVPNANSFRQLGQGFVPITTAGAQTPVAFFSGSNPLLQPEESRGKNLGFVWSPGGVLNGANIELDWWKIRIDNTMVTDSPTQILNDCYIDGVAARCGQFTRDAALGFVNTLSFGLRNAGYREHEGVDLNLSYQWETDYGNFSSSLLSTYMIGQEFKSTNDATARPQQQTSLGSNYRLRSNFSLSWEYGDFGVTWGARYFSKMKEACLSATRFPDECSDPGVGRVTNDLPVNTNVLGSNTFHDLQVRWKAPWNAVISVGANNITEHLGPPTYSQIDSNVTYNGGFDIGRFWYARYQQNF